MDDSSQMTDMGFKKLISVSNKPKISALGMHIISAFLCKSPEIYI